MDASRAARLVELLESPVSDLRQQGGELLAALPLDARLMILDTLLERDRWPLVLQLAWPDPRAALWAERRLWVALAEHRRARFADFGLCAPAPVPEGLSALAERLRETPDAAQEEGIEALRRSLSEAIAARLGPRDRALARGRWLLPAQLVDEVGRRPDAPERAHRRCLARYRERLLPELLLSLDPWLEPPGQAGCQNLAWLQLIEECHDDIARQISIRSFRPRDAATVKGQLRAAQQELVRELQEPFVAEDRRVLIARLGALLQTAPLLVGM